MYTLICLRFQLFQQSSQTCGPDNLPPVLFKKVKHCLAKPLSLLFNQLVSVAAVPVQWKQSIITPVFKKGTTGDVSKLQAHIVNLRCA